MERIGRNFKRQFDLVRWIPFLNNASEEVPAHGVLRITDAATEDGRGNVTYLKCDKPSSTFQRFYAINGPSPVPAGNYGSCTLDGPVYALYEGGTPAYHEGWGPKPSSWKLNKNYPGGGFVVCGGNNTTDTITLVQPHPVTTLIGKLNGTLSQGSSQAVSIWRGAGGSEADETGMDLTCYDWLMKSGATAIASGKKVVLQNINGVWYVTEAECA